MKKVLIGKINSVFGIKGEVKIISYCQHPLDIEKYPLFDKNDNAFSLKISNKNKTAIGTTAGGTILIAKIIGVDDRNKAESLRGAELFVERANFKKLQSDEFYQVDLIGLDVIDDSSEKVIGKVVNVMDFGAGTMLEIQFNEENPEKKLEKIENFPFKNEIFPEVDVRGGTIKIKLPEVVEIK